MHQSNPLLDDVGPQSRKRPRYRFWPLNGHKKPFKLKKHVCHGARTTTDLDTYTGKANFHASVPANNLLNNEVRVTTT